MNKSTSCTTSSQVVEKYGLASIPKSCSAGLPCLTSFLFLFPLINPSNLTTSFIPFLMTVSWFFFSILCFWVANLTSLHHLILTSPDPCCAISLPVQTSSKSDSSSWIEGSCYSMIPSSFSQKYNLYNQCSSNYFSLPQDQRNPETSRSLDNCFKLQLHLSFLHISCKQPPACK